MRVDVNPRQADIIPGEPQPVTITITNTSTVIGGYAVRILGADPGWVRLDAEQISLFPEETRSLTALVTAPRGIPAGSRRIAVQVRELTPPEDSTITELDLTVPASRSLQLRVDPLAVTAGRNAAFSVIVENTGNTSVQGALAGDDPEGKVRFTFSPESVSLGPGEHALVDMRATARRHVTGAPTVRLLGLYLDESTPDAFFRDDGDEADRPPRARDERHALAHATFLQKALLSRGPLSLLGLLAAVTVFAIVITLALSRLVGQSTADRDLALQVAAARNATGTGGTSGVAGTVRLLTSGTGVPAVSVSVFSSSDTSTPVATTATNASGAYSVANLAAGKYKISYRGAGFVQLWYPGAATDADATVVTLDPAQTRAGLDVTLGGVPATINGKVVGDDVSNATLFLETGEAHGGTTPDAGRAAPVPTTTGPPVAPPGNGAVVQTVPIGADGTFSLTNVPSPSIYDLVVVKAGYATSTQRIDIGAGETRNGVQLTLARGDGLISGMVNSTTGALGGVTITATAGQSTANTVSLTVGQTGAFTLRSLPTPASFTIVASKAGYASQTLTLTLTAGQKLTGVAITLSTTSGGVHGRVTLSDGTGASGVAVTVTDGKLTAQTVTESTGTVGSWRIGGLPVPGTYTITFARSDLSAQTVSVSLDGGGVITPSQSLRVDAQGAIEVSMQSNTQDVYGFVSQSGASDCSATSSRLSEATVTLNSGASTYTTTTAGASTATCGEYYFDQVPPGTYTLTVSAGSGTSPRSQVISVVAGGVPQRVDVPLPAPASMTGRLVSATATDQGLCGWTVNIYLQAQYPTVITATATTTCTGSNPAGTFLITDIPAGTYVVEVRQTPGSTPAASKQVFVQPSERTNAGTIKVSTNG